METEDLRIEAASSLECRGMQLSDFFIWKPGSLEDIFLSDRGCVLCFECRGMLFPDFSIWKPGGREKTDHLIHQTAACVAHTGQSIDKGSIQK